VSSALGSVAGRASGFVSPAFVIPASILRARSPRSFLMPNVAFALA